MDSDDLEKILESSLEDENIIVSDPSLFPCKLIWIVSNNSYITKHQTIAITKTNTHHSFNSGDTSTTVDDSDTTRDTMDTTVDRDTPLDNTVDKDNPVNTVDRSIKSEKSGILIRLVDNMCELRGETIIGRIEPFDCNHDIVIHGLCTSCSQPIDNKRKFNQINNSTSNSVNSVTNGNSVSGSVSSGGVGFLSNNNDMIISNDVIYKMECNEILNYLTDGKLCLVLDLDNTLLHATSQPPPPDIAIPILSYNTGDYYVSNRYIQYGTDAVSIELQQKLENSVIKTIVFNETETSYCYSYFKLRPGIFEFFHKISSKYRLFLFTMGTKQHAASALQVIDPNGIYFANRIFSRYHSNNIHSINSVHSVHGVNSINSVNNINSVNMSKAGLIRRLRNELKYCMKSLDRIFPNYKNLVLMMDDTEHVWTNNLGLIKVHPYYYFSDLSYLNSYDLNNLTKSSASLQSICNYSNYVWSKLIHTANLSTTDHLTNANSVNSVTSVNSVNSVNSDKVMRDSDGFVIPKLIKRSDFRYNGYLICNQRPNNIFNSINTIDSTIGSGNSIISGSSVNSTIGSVNSDKIRIKDNDKQLYKIIKLLNQIHTTFFHQYHSLTTNIGDTTDNSDRDDTTNTTDTTDTVDTVDNMNKIENNIDDEKLREMLENEMIPSASKILQELREKVLEKFVLYSNTCEFINLSNLNSSESEEINFLLCSDFGKWATKFGAKIRKSINTTTTNTNTNSNTINNTNLNNSINSEITHLIVNNKSNIKMEGVKKVHIKWLEAVIYCHEYINEDKFNPDQWEIPYRSFWDILNS